MKNFFYVLGALIILIIISNVMTKKNLIPEDAIRIRVIGNSNSKEDQELKINIKNDLEKYLYSKLSNVKDTNKADKIINNEIPNVKKIVNKYTTDYDINYGINHFPEKEYKSIIYDEGDYKSLVITLGNGLGNNWWCVLFPPLCLLEGSESTDVEYHSYVVDMINRYK